MPQNPEKTSQARARTTVGPGGMMYLIIAGMILGVAIYMQANLLFWAFGLMVGGLLVSLVISWLMMRGIVVERLMPEHGVAGEMLMLRYRIENNNLWTAAFGVVIYETWGKGSRGYKKQGPIADWPRRLMGRPFGWVLHVGPRQAVQAQAPIWPQRRGVLGFEKIVVSTSFPFGIVRRSLVFYRPGELLIYPRLYRLNRRLLASATLNDIGGRKHVDRSGGNEEFFGLRKYNPGDSVRKIDWKHSAKTGTLVCRENTRPNPPRIMLALDLVELSGQTPEEEKPQTKHRKDKTGHSQSDVPRTLTRHESIERAVSLAASMICDAHLHGYQVGLVVAGMPSLFYPMHHSLPHRTKMLECLSRLDLTSRRLNPTALPLMPSVVIGTGPGFDSANSRALHLSADDLERYVVNEGTAYDGLLVRRPITARKRDHAWEAQP
ncbi:MAG: DUF58 domain-containing protein [Phycisphaera sp.]|nr:DUF58 domain-containing protein [Phycisphaera sp.]